jgi:small ligand-binding sensory domain FIST
VLSSAIPVATRLTQGCLPLPHRHTITEAQGNVIVTIDGRPALEVLRADIGPTLARDLERAAHIIHAALPVAGSDTGDYVVRNLIGADSRRGLIAIAAEVESGMPLMFCRRDSDAARADLDRMLDAILEDVPGAPRGALYFSCLGRGEHMFGARSAELEHVRARLGDVPLAGFFCNGEISHDRLYGYTGVLAVFS